MERASGKKGLVAAIVVLVVVLVVGVAAYRAFYGEQIPSQAVEQGSSDTSSADAVMLADYDSEVYTQDEVSTKLSIIADGKPLVVNFWATWCPHCIDEMPDFQKLYEKYGDRISFCMLDAVGTRNETLARGASYVREEGFTFPVYYDLDGDAVDTYRVTSYPSTVIFDANGELWSYYIGRIDTATVDAELADLL